MDKTTLILTRDVPNEYADKRTKSQWQDASVFKKGSRFSLLTYTVGEFGPNSPEMCELRPVGATRTINSRSKLYDLLNPNLQEQAQSIADWLQETLPQDLYAVDLIRIMESRGQIEPEEVKSAYEALKAEWETEEN